MSTPYPCLNSGDAEQAGRVGSIERLRLYFRNSKRRERGQQRHRGVDLTPVRMDRTPLAADDVVLICVMRNTVHILLSFLAHHRALGIRRFAFVDDQSDDGTRALMLDQPDVDVFASSVRFRDADLGLVWRDLLVDTYGRNRWYVSIDSDEYLIYPGCEQRPVQAFVADLQRHGLTRSFAVMLDIYPEGPIGEVGPLLPATALPTTVCPLHDTDSFDVAREKIGTAIRGGPRGRIFTQRMRLNKFPVIYADRHTQFSGAGAHSPLPLWRNFGLPAAVLLHHKFTPGAIESFHREAAEAQRGGSTVHYADLVAHRRFSNALDMRYPGSDRFEGSQKLVRNGFMRDLRLAGTDADAATPITPA